MTIEAFPQRRRPAPFEVIYPVRWQGIEPQPIEWIVEGVVPRRAVVLFSGDSGLGKSLAMQQLQGSCNFGRDWLGFPTTKCRSFGLYCEDPEQILNYRQINICKHLGCEMQDLEEVSYISRVGQDNSFMDFDRKTEIGRTSPLYDQTLAHCRDFEVNLLILDTRAQIFNGFEISRKQVTSFVSKLQAIADEINGAVIITDHPSNQGLADGRGSSGSTAWRASVRCHMYLKRPKGYDEDDEQAKDDRVLKTMKSNWGPSLQSFKIQWKDGVFVREGAALRGGMLWELELEGKIEKGLRYLVERGTRIPLDPTSPKNAPTLLRAQIADLREIPARSLSATIEKMMAKGRLVKATVKGGFLLRPADMRYPGEPEGSDPAPPAATATAS